MRQPLLALAVAGTLGACAQAPRKPTPPQAAAPQPETPATATRRVSPYAPAQEDLSKRGDYVAGGLYAPGVRDSAPPDLHDVDLIPEPEVVALPRALYGNRTPYAVLGKQYTVLGDTRGYVEQGVASFYGNKFHGRRTSSLEVYDMYAFSAAHRSLPLPSFARVTNLDTGKSVIVRVNDRGPFHDGRLIDLSFAAATKLGITRRGTGRVEVRALQPGEVDVPTAVVAAPLLASTGMDTLVAALPATSAPVVTALPDTQPARASVPAPTAAVTPAAETAAPGPTDTTAPNYRFDMQQDGRPMTAEQFDAWMRARQVRVATGRPTPVVAPTGPTVATPATAQSEGLTAGVTQDPVSMATSATIQRPPAPTANGVVGASVQLQVAAFGARENAERALALLREAGIDGARVVDGQAGGKPVFRLRVATAHAGVDALSNRLVGLGFGPPQRVRD